MAGTDGTSYPDVVISYSREDEDWVTKQLLPRLKGHGITCFVDVENLHGGDNWRARIADAIRNCRHLLLVLTPSWMASDECKYEAYGAYVLDPWEMKGKLVPIERIKCLDSKRDDDRTKSSVPDWVKSRNALCFTGDAIPDATWDRLVADLSAPPLAAGPGESLGAILYELPNALKNLGMCLVHMEGVRDGVKRIGVAKELHDVLHDLGLVWPSVLADYANVKRQPDDRTLWKSWQDKLVVVQLSFRVGKIAQAFETPADRLKEHWVTEVTQRTADLQAAIARRLEAGAQYPDPMLQDFVDARAAFEDVQLIVLGQPSHLNKVIVEEAERLRLTELAQGLDDMTSALSGGDASSGNRAVDRVREIARDVRTLKSTIDFHVECHKRMQALHDAVAHVNPATWDGSLDFRAEWAMARRPLTPLAGAPLKDLWWATELSELGENLTAKTKEIVFQLDAARNAFGDFLSRVLHVFRDVDDNLRKFCDGRLKPLGERLSEILEQAAQGG